MEKSSKDQATTGGSYLYSRPLVLKMLTQCVSIPLAKSLVLVQACWKDSLPHYLIKAFLHPVGERLILDCGFRFHSVSAGGPNS